MKTAKLGPVVLAAALVVITAGLFFRAHGQGGRATGFYQAESSPAAGFRTMSLAGTDGKSETLYVALVPDLMLEDFTGAVRRPIGLDVHLNAGGQARVRTLSRERTQGGRKGREAILVDGRIVAAPGFREEMTMSSFLISGPDMEHADWAEKLSQEISAANNANAPGR